MEEEKKVTGTVEITDGSMGVSDVLADTADSAPIVAEESVSPSVETAEAPATASDVTETPDTPEEKEDITARLRRAGDRIDRASTDADAFRRRRDKDSASVVEIDGDKVRETERRKLEEENKKREAAREESRAKMEYAESYRARLRAEREGNAAARKKAEEKERARAEERSAREREIAEGIERERDEARARAARAESLLTKVDGSVTTATAATADSAPETADTPTPVSSEAVAAPVTEAPVASPVAEPVSASATPEAAPAPASATESATPDTDYVITIEDDTPKKDILYIDGSTACEITVGSAALATAASVAPAVSAVPVAASPAATAALTPAPARTAPATPVAPTRPASGYTEIVREGSDTAAERGLDEYSSMVAAVKGSDVPSAPVELVTGTPIGDYEADRELLRHADDVSKKQYVTTKRGEDFDVMPKYPDPVGKPLTPKEAKRREKEAREEEKRALLEFERASKKGRMKKAQKSAEERAIEEYETAEEALRAVDESVKVPATPAPVHVTEKTAPVSSVDPYYPDPKPASPPVTEAPRSTKPATIFDKKALDKNRKRQEKNDLLLIEHRIYNDIRRLEMDTRTGDISFTARIEAGKERRERTKKRTELTDTRRQLKLAKKYETEDNSRYYHIVLTDLERARLPKRADREELKELRDKVVSLLKKRDDLNLKLIELYSLSEGGKSGKAQGRFNAELEGKRRAFKRQLPAYKRYERAKISLADKEVLYPLMDERTELQGELAKINYMLKKEKAKGLAKKELLRDKRKVERRLGENKRAILHHENKAMKKAEREADGNRSAIIGWTAIGIIAVAAVLIVVFWKDIQPWLMNVALPWIGEKFSQLVSGIKSSGSGTPETPAT